MGLYLYSPHPEPEVNLNYSRPLFFSRHIFESLLDAQDYLILQDPEQVQRSILIDDLNMLATDFNITLTDMDKLIESGRKATQKFISKNFPATINNSLQLQ